MEFYWLVVGILCVWRVTHLLYAEDGPWDLLVRLRMRAGTGFWGQLLDCFYCLSFWVAVPVALMTAEGWKWRLLLWPALSAGASLLERAAFYAREPMIKPAPYLEDSEELHALLRKQERIDSRDEPNPPNESKKS